MPSIPPALARALRTVRVDLPPAGEQPRPAAVAVATAVALAGSLIADALLVALGRALFPSTTHYQHYAVGDWSKLTIVGVLVACAAWPIVTRLTSQPSWVFSRLAVLVTVVLLLPDAALLARGDAAGAVLTLVLMHLAIALVTYQALVHLAPVPTRRPTPDRRPSRVR